MYPCETKLRTCCLFKDTFITELYVSIFTPIYDKTERDSHQKDYANDVIWGYVKIKFTLYLYVQNMKNNKKYKKRFVYIYI